MALSSAFWIASPSSMPKISRMYLRSPVFNSLCNLASASFLANAWLTSILRALPVSLNV